MNKNASVFVAGYTVVESVDRKDRTQNSIALIVRNKVGRNPMIKVSATHNGTLWIDKGFTLEEVKKAYPYGTPVIGYMFGEEVATQFGGVYKVVETEKAVISALPAEQEPVEEGAEIGDGAE